jgi:hypothetical protein
MAASSGTALRRLQQSDACDHHHTEYANGFHSLFYDSMSLSANWTINLLRLASSVARPLPASVAVQQSVDAFVGPGGTSAWQVKANAPFRQAENALNFPLARRAARIAPQIKLTASRELFLRGLPSHD